MEKKFTKGKWEIGRTTSESDIILMNGNFRAAALPYGATPNEEDFANARLMASAPDLLEALEGMLSILEDSAGVAGYHMNGAVAQWDEFPEVGKAKEAINKAL